MRYFAVVFFRLHVFVVYGFLKFFGGKGFLATIFTAFSAAPPPPVPPVTHVLGRFK